MNLNADAAGAEYRTSFPSLREGTGILLRSGSAYRKKLRQANINEKYPSAVFHTKTAGKKPAVLSRENVLY